MLASTILRTLRQRWTERRLTRFPMPEPLDHPSLQAMSLRELADLPLEPPPAPGLEKGVPAPLHRLSAQAFRGVSVC